MVSRSPFSKNIWHSWVRPDISSEILLLCGDLSKQSCLNLRRICAALAVIKGNVIGEVRRTAGAEFSLEICQSKYREPQMTTWIGVSELTDKTRNQKKQKKQQWKLRLRTASGLVGISWRCIEKQILTTFFQHLIGKMKRDLNGILRHIFPGGQLKNGLGFWRRASSEQKNFAADQRFDFWTGGVSCLSPLSLFHPWPNWASVDRTRGHTKARVPEQIFASSNGFQSTGWVHVWGFCAF